MPFYDFRCRDCDATFEVRLPVERRDDAACPSCGGRHLKRALPVVYALVKGAAPAAADGCCGGGDGAGCCGGACACAATRTAGGAV